MLLRSESQIEWSQGVLLQLHVKSSVFSCGTSIFVPTLLRSGYLIFAYCPALVHKPLIFYLGWHLFDLHFLLFCLICPQLIGREWHLSRDPQADLHLYRQCCIEGPCWSFFLSEDDFSNWSNSVNTACFYPQTEPSSFQSDLPRRQGACHEIVVHFTEKTFRACRISP